MKKMYKAIALVLCAALLVAGSVFGTLAYLKSQTETLTNTFTAGKVEITLHEYQLEEAGKIVMTGEEGNKTPVKANGPLTGIKLVPGRVIEKNPVITVKEGSEACYLFVKIDDGLKTFATINLDAKKWIQIGTTNIYYYKETVSAPADNDPATAADVEVSVFPSITCKDVTTYGNATDISLAITAYAVQAEGFDNAAAAWSNTFGKTNG